MVIVTKISPQKKSGRVNVYLDGKFGFGIDLDNFVKLKLRVEQELADEEVEEIIKKAEFQKTLDRLLRFASVRPRSEKEFRDWLRRKKIHESLHKSLFEKLTHFDLVDDEAFAKWWVEQRQAFRPKPKRILTQELRIKGIKDEIVSVVLGETDIDEGGLAKRQLEKNIHRWQGLAEKERRQKAAQFLLRKGFDWETVRKVLAIDQEA